MEVLHQRCAGIDVSKRDAKVCLRVQGGRRHPTTRTVTTWGATIADILALREMLLAARVDAVVMESTSNYWKPLYYVLEDAFAVQLVNAREAKNVPGRKTDVSDAEWLADLGAHGLVRASLVPPPPIRQLRELTRLRTTVLRDRTRELQRLEKLLEEAQIKLSSVVTDLNGLSSRAILAALAAGESDPVALAGLARGKLLAKRDALIAALRGAPVSDHHRYLIGLHLRRIDAHTADAADLTVRIEEAMAPFHTLRELMVSIPGISADLATMIIAEIGDDISMFPTAQHLVSWAGVAPGSKESAGRAKPATVRPGNRHLKGAIGIAALAATRSKNTFLAARYHRLVARRGKMRALVAIERSILTAIWHMLTTGTYYQDLGGDYYSRYHPARATRRALRDLRAAGYQVTLTPLPTAS